MGFRAAAKLVANFYLPQIGCKHYARSVTGDKLRQFAIPFFQILLGDPSIGHIFKCFTSDSQSICLALSPKNRRLCFDTSNLALLFSASNCFLFLVFSPKSILLCLHFRLNSLLESVGKINILYNHLGEVDGKQRFQFLDLILNLSGQGGTILQQRHGAVAGEHNFGPFFNGGPSFVSMIS